MARSFRQVECHVGSITSNALDGLWSSFRGYLGPSRTACKLSCFRTNSVQGWIINHGSKRQLFAKRYWKGEGREKTANVLQGKLSNVLQQNTFVKETLLQVF